MILLYKRREHICKLNKASQGKINSNTAIKLNYIDVFNTKKQMNYFDYSNLMEMKRAEIVRITEECLLSFSSAMTP